MQRSNAVQDFKASEDRIETQDFVLGKYLKTLPEI